MTLAPVVQVEVRDGLIWARRRGVPGWTLALRPGDVAQRRKVSASTVAQWRDRYAAGTERPYPIHVPHGYVEVMGVRLVLADALDVWEVPDRRCGPRKKDAS